MLPVNGFKPIAERDVPDLFEFIANSYTVEKAEEDYRDQLIQAVLTEGQLEKIRELQEEFAGRILALQENRREAEEALKAKTIEAGQTIAHGPHRAVYNKGRVTWDNKGLDGLMLAVPQLKELRKEGQPYVSIKIGSSN